MNNLKQEEKRTHELKLILRRAGFTVVSNDRVFLLIEVSPGVEIEVNCAGKTNENIVPHTIKTIFEAGVLRGQNKVPGWRKGVSYEYYNDSTGESIDYSNIFNIWTLYKNGFMIDEQLSLEAICEVNDIFLPIEKE